MQSVPTTTITIFRGTAVDEYGDVQDTDTVHLTKVPCSLLEQRQYFAGNNQDEPDIIRYAIARVPANTDVNSGDRVKDERTGVVYVVDNYTQIQNPNFVTDIRLDLRHT